MSLLAPSLCRTCARLLAARQSGNRPDIALPPALQRWSFLLSFSGTARTARRPLHQASRAKAKKASKSKQADGNVNLSIADQLKAAFSAFGEEEEPHASVLPTKKKKSNKQNNKKKQASKSKQADVDVNLSIEDQFKAAFAAIEDEEEPHASVLPTNKKKNSTQNNKKKAAQPKTQQQQQPHAAAAEAAPPPRLQRQKQQLSSLDELKAAFESDISLEKLEDTFETWSEEKEKQYKRSDRPKPKKLDIRGSIGNRAAQKIDDLVPVSKTIADALSGIKLPTTTTNKKSKPTKTDGIGMLNQRVATTSTRMPPRFTSPTETPPHEYARQEFYLAPSGSFTYDVDVVPFDWRNQENYAPTEPKRQPWEPVEQVPPPGVILPRWWPKTHEGWDQLDGPQLHAAEEAYARFNPKQPTESQQYHRAKKAVVRAFDEHKRELRQQAEHYAMQIKAAQSGARVRAPPSAASGGVPDPSQAYLARAAEPSERLDAAQPLLVVVDLNGTMLHRPDPKRNPRRFVHRPFAPVFLNYLMKTFWVVVWSSARADNVAVMCDALATPQAIKSDVVAVWARDKFGLDPADYDSHVQCYKRLTRLWDDPAIARSHPDYAAGGRWSQANTVLLDDTPEKARAEPYNAIIVPEFSNDNGPYDAILPTVHDYINELCFQSNVSSYMRENPFHARPAAAAEPASSMAFYNTKRTQRDRKKARKDYTYAVSSLNLRNTVSRAKKDELAKLRGGSGGGGGRGGSSF